MPTSDAGCQVIGDGTMVPLSETAIPGSNETFSSRPEPDSSDWTANIFWLYPAHVTMTSEFPGMSRLNRPSRSATAETAVPATDTVAPTGYPSAHDVTRPASLMQAASPAVFLPSGKAADTKPATQSGII